MPRKRTQEEQEQVEDEQRRVVRGRDAGRTVKEMARELGCSIATIYRRETDGLIARAAYRKSKEL